MSDSSLTPWLNTLLADFDGVHIQQKRPRRIRIDIASDALATLLALLKGKASFVHLSAITCVDWLDEDEFELVYHLWSYESRALVSVHTRITREPGRFLSVYDLFQPAAFFERDIFEMFGVFFEGSPWMEKFILTEWDGPPPMLKTFDSEKYVMETFRFQDYRPDWLEEVERQGGGISKKAEDVRK